MRRNQDTDLRRDTRLRQVMRRNQDTDLRQVTGLHRVTTDKPHQATVLFHKVIRPITATGLITGLPQVLRRRNFNATTQA